MLQVLRKKDIGSNQKHPQIAPNNQANPARISLKGAIIILVVFWLMLATVRWNVLRIRERFSRFSAPASVTLINEVEHLPAPSCKAIPLSLPHNSVVSIQVRVLRGDLFDVFVIAPDQLEGILKGEWKNVKSVGGFAAIKTDSYQHTAHLAKGGYYLVVMDRMVSVPSSLPSDVSVLVQLK